MSENAAILLPSDVHLESIFSRLPEDALGQATAAEIASGKSVGFYFGPSVREFMEIYPISREAWDYEDERRQGTFKKLGINDPHMIAFAYRSFETLQRLLALLLPNEDGWFLDNDGGTRPITKGIVEAKRHHDGSLY